MSPKETSSQNSGSVIPMGWSEEVHARRLLDIRERRKKEKCAGKYAVPQVKGNAGSLPMAILIGTLSSVVAWKKEGRYLRGRDVRRIPYVGNWLAEHVPRWRDDSPRKKAAGAAARRAKAQSSSGRSEATAAFEAVSALHAQQPSEPAEDAAKSGTAPASSSNPRADFLPASAQQGTPKKPRTRKRSKRK
ncbi:hypothetical protein WJX75_009283 [Coccomyxa subellipsoidea]|uniref:Uncharacterized protein n=1 Tax=Coccomyxa subellipsoidea TaxID=248742 RepID=A0ABR2YJF3_9CHLO